MELRWIHESPAIWDVGKARIVGSAGTDVFEPSLIDRPEGALVPSDWWRVEADGKTVAYGWMDITWGDAEMGLAVEPDHQRKGVGTFVLDRLEEEAAVRGVHYLYNVVRASHPQQQDITQWLEARRFTSSQDGKLLRAVVRLKKAVVG
ncbi:MAG: GNAT family N-acetyltransferase [Nannocystaceae bacterium]|nr:GNAT family N-acetyltransferase [Nannocystaceae bacterium]